MLSLTSGFSRTISLFVTYPFFQYALFSYGTVAPIYLSASDKLGCLPLHREGRIPYHPLFYDALTGATLAVLRLFRACRQLYAQCIFF